MAIAAYRVADTLTDWFTRRLGLVVIGLALFATVATLWIAGSSFQRLGQRNQELLHSHHAVVLSAEVLVSILNAETGARGYIITGNTAYLQAFSEGGQASRAQLGQLRALLQHLPAQRERLQALEGLIDRRLEMMSAAIALRERDGFEAARRLMEADGGKAVIDEIRMQIAALENEQVFSHQKRSDELLADFALVRASLFLVCLINIVLIVIAGRLIWRDTRRVRRRESELLDNKLQLEKAVGERTAELNELSNYLHHVQEEERAHLARELHDELSSTLAAVKIDVSHVRDKFASGNEAAVQRLSRAIQQLDEVIKIKRRIIDDLHPSLLDNLGIAAALRWQCQEFSARTNYSCRFSLYDDEMRLPKPYSIALFRILQEALTNIHKHAGASEVDVSITRQEDMLVCEITDDGIGIDLEKSAHPTSHGLSGMRQRARALGGTFRIARGQRRGTVITIRLPMPEIAECAAAS